LQSYDIRIANTKSPLVSFPAAVMVLLHRSCQMSNTSLFTNIKVKRTAGYVYDLVTSFQ